MSRKFHVIMFCLLQSLLRSYSNCFVGREFVDWLVQVKEAENRDEVGTVVRSFLRSFVPSFLRSFVPSFLRSFLRSFVRSFVC